MGNDMAKWLFVSKENYESCNEAKHILRSQKIEFKVFSIDNEKDAMLADDLEVKTIPAIYDTGKKKLIKLHKLIK